MTTETFNLRIADPHLPYFADGIISLVMGLACIALAAPLTQLVGWSLPPELFIALGIFLVPWGGINYLTSQIPQPSRSILLGNIAVDATWFLGSIVLMVMTASSLTTAGWVFIAVQAIAVLNMCLIKIRGLRPFGY